MSDKAIDLYIRPEFESGALGAAENVDVERELSLVERISNIICHPGGPKVMEAFQEALELAPEALEPAWDSLRKLGNLSSASVLMVLRDTMDRARPPEGSYSLMLAMGPGFCSELVLLQW